MRQFLVNGVKCDVSFDADCLRWWPATSVRKSAIDSGESNEEKKKKNKKQHYNVSKVAEKRIEFGHILALKKPPTRSLEANKSNHRGDKRKKPDKIQVYYAKQNHNNSTDQLLKLKKVTIEPIISSTAFYHTSLATPTTTTTKPTVENEKTELAKSPIDWLAEQIARELELRRQKRPKRLLVFANPYGGKGKAVQLYKSQVRRLLELAGIEAKLVITKYANHARDTIEDPMFNVEYFDGIICVGGDGMFSELMNGLVFRYNRNKILEAQLRDQSKLSAGETSEQRAASPTISDEVDCLGSTSDTNSKSTIHCDIDSSSTQSKAPSPPLVSQNNPTDEKRFAQLKLALGGIGQQFVSPPIPVGVIGAGSTDANSFGLIGTNDVITATLNIILGNQIKIDVCSIHSYHEDRVLRFVSTFVAYGYFGDVIRESEKLRWLGPSRYDVTGVNTLMKNRTYKGSVKILVSSRDGSPQKSERCHTNCELCQLTTSHEYNNQNSDAREQERQRRPRQLEIDRANHDDLKFLERRGAFIGVNAAVTACRCPQTKKGFSPSNHLANGCADLILVRPCTRMQYIQYLLRTGWTKMSPFDLKYVEAYRCRQFEFVAEQDVPKGEGTSVSSSTTSTTSSASSSSSTVDEGLASSLDSNHSTQLSKGLISNSFSSWNADGELLNVQSVRVKVNNQLLRVFGTGEPQQTSN